VRAVLKCGASISELNCVRKQISAVKGGRLARAAGRARICTLALSDVPGDDPAIIGSGPTVPDPTRKADALAMLFVTLSAVLAGVKDIRAAVDQAELILAQSGRRTILFVDEVHRFNKAQQDAFLPFVERGLLTFIGATTENPSFEVNSALLSRAAVYVLKSLSMTELAELFDRARAKAFPDLDFDAEARERLIGHADGDARRLLNVLETLRTAAAAAGVKQVDGAFLESTLARDLRRFDKGGEAFYDQISALHKSVRGSDPDAALYWFCRMLDGGADPLYLARRIIRMASEDIGLADPRARCIARGAAPTN
jgi:putative ATPase